LCVMFVRVYMCVVCVCVSGVCVCMCGCNICVFVCNVKTYTMRHLGQNWSIALPKKTCSYLTLKLLHPDTTALLVCHAV